MAVVLPGEKFAAIAVTEVGLSDAFPNSIDLKNDLLAMTHPPVDIGTVWGSWLGDIIVRELEKAKLWLVAKMPSAMPHIVNDENKRLKETVGYLFHALLLACPIQIGIAVRLNGGNDGTMAIRGYEQLDHYFHTTGLEALLGRADLDLARRLMDGLVALHTAGAWERVGRGLQAFWHGLTERYFQDRLHQFVRCLEGVTKPEIRSTRSQFTHRCQTFTGASPAARQILKECFDIRSHVEHLHNWKDALPHVSLGEQYKRLGSHLRRIETLSRHVYKRLATDNAIVDLFQDASLDTFWQLRDDERHKKWGAVLDITAIH